jgi:hypothetical protein
MRLSIPGPRRAIFMEGQRYYEGRDEPQAATSRSKGIHRRMGVEDRRNPKRANHLQQAAPGQARGTIEGPRLLIATSICKSNPLLGLSEIGSSLLGTGQPSSPMNLMLNQKQCPLAQVLVGRCHMRPRIERRQQTSNASEGALLRLEYIPQLPQTT